MTQLTALKALEQAVVAGTKHVPALFNLIQDAGLKTSTGYGSALAAYNGSLDAAKDLHEAVLPEWAVNSLDQASNLAGAPWGCELAYFDGFNPNNNMKAYSRHDFDGNPARAWLLAIIRALNAQLEGE